MTFEVIKVTLGGRTFRACRQCVGHVEFTIDRLKRVHPDATLQIIQPPWNEGVDASAGSHDKCATFDVAILGVEWFPAQRFLRECGWAAWYRFPPTFSHHIHMISLTCPGPLASLIPGQVLDYHNHAFGLKNQHEPNSDKSWFPQDIDATEFDFQAWEDRMKPEDFDRLRQIVREEIDKTTVPNPSNPDGQPWKLTRAIVDIWKRAGK